MIFTQPRTWIAFTRVVNKFVSNRDFLLRNLGSTILETLFTDLTNLIIG